MRLLVTADLHYNHARSKALAEDIINEMNGVGADVLLVVGDTASSQGDELEKCLSRFRFDGPKLLVAGNHDLWSAGGDSYAILNEDLPRRAAALGWQWIQNEPFVSGDIAIIGSVGWYDYSFAAERLGIPSRFYQRKVSPGAAARLSEMAHLFETEDDIGAVGKSIVARWNDGRYVKLGRSDEEFLDELLDVLSMQLGGLRDARSIVAAVHHLPFRELLPPGHFEKWDFARAYLGSDKIGELLMRYANVSHVFSGHSHFPADAKVGHIRAINIGSGYRVKKFWVGEIS